MWVNSAIYKNGMISVTFTCYQPGIGYNNRTEFLYTTPTYNWNSIDFYSKHKTTYINFLNTMVVKTLDIKRKIAKLALYEALDTGKITDVMNAITILDPTFDPPIFNQRARWQRELEFKIAEDTSLMVISTCYNGRNLNRYFKTLMLM